MKFSYLWLVLLDFLQFIYCRQKCYSCGYNTNPKKNGVECVFAPGNISVNWAIRCELNCFYTSQVFIDTKEVLAMTRGCTENIGETGCDDHPPYQFCRYTCSGDFCNSGLSGVLVDSTGGGVVRTMFMPVLFTAVMSAGLGTFVYGQTAL